MPDFKIGDEVEIQVTPTSLSGLRGFNGLRGVVVTTPTKGRTEYFVVAIKGHPRTGWFPHQLILVDDEAQARELLGDDYFD